MIKNPYFHPKHAEESDQTETKAFKAYPSGGIATPDITPEGKPGFTSIIIPAYFVSYPVYHYTGHTIGSIREHTDKEKTPYEIILIQNGEDFESKFTTETYRDTYCDKVISNKENLGYAKAVNQGIRVASGEFIAILNNDIMVFDHWLEDMQECLNYVALVNAMPMYGMPFARGVEAKKFRNATLVEGAANSDTIEETLSKDLGDRDFSCVLTRKKVFSQVGLFNEEFFMYGEDLDLIDRIERAGGVVAATRRVRTFHVTGATASQVKETPDIMNKSKSTFRRLQRERNV